eukprot:TRINITY_DN3974_c1_g1_i6.p1 TRINITY_DN3974_c1_g1~~TRINITY_DN3974_c1_g1_i6.p1  ORF type:complete len:725 (-),score=132.85 TRINITY_DN3974_c1_g1_i6:1220-3394(-)
METGDIALVRSRSTEEIPSQPRPSKIPKPRRVSSARSPSFDAPIVATNGEKKKKSPDSLRPSLGTQRSSSSLSTKAKDLVQAKPPKSHRERSLSSKGAALPPRSQVLELKSKPEPQTSLTDGSLSAPEQSMPRVDSSDEVSRQSPEGNSPNIDEIENIPSSSNQVDCPLQDDDDDAKPPVVDSQPSKTLTRSKSARGTISAQNGSSALSREAPGAKKLTKPGSGSAKDVRYATVNGNSVKLDMKEWKRKKRIEEKTKVFMVNGPYPDARQLFLERGWVENTDPESPFYDFRWCLKGQDIDFKNLRKEQVVNHFPCATEITTKVGLCRNVRSVSWYEATNVNSFFPICFDLGNCHERLDFIEEFRYVAAESIMKHHVMSLQSNADVQGICRVLRFALSVCQKRVDQLTQNHDDIDHETQEPTQAQWDDLLQYSYLLNDLDIARRKSSIKPSGLATVATGVRKVLKRLAEFGQMEAVPPSMSHHARELYEILQEKSPQFQLNGTHNVWIVKPAGKSRGRGIEVFNRLDKLMEYISVEGHFVAQKYMENPMVLLNRKFDIRQWVLVTRWNPLTIFFYGDCYLRFTSTDFDIDNLDKFAHLCNNSIQKYSEDFNSNAQIEGNMWSSDEFADYLRRAYGSDDIWLKQIQPALKKIVISTLKCGQDTIENRKNTYEMFGFDLMLDNQLKPWLIEVNSSPTLEHCTPVTTRLCANVVIDIMKCKCNLIKST